MSTGYIQLRESKQALENYKSYLESYLKGLNKKEKTGSKLELTTRFYYGGEGEIRPLRVSLHAQPCVGSPSFADAAIPGRFSDIQSALTALRISWAADNKKAPTLRQELFLLWRRGGDSNSRSLARQQISSLSPSAARTPLHIHS